MSLNNKVWPAQSVAEMWRKDEDRRQQDRIELANEQAKSDADHTARALLADSAWQESGLAETAERWGVGAFMRQAFINAWLGGFETAHKALRLNQSQEKS